MSDVAIHPTAAVNPAVVRRLEDRTGMRVRWATGGRYAILLPVVQRPTRAELADAAEISVDWIGDHEPRGAA